MARPMQQQPGVPDTQDVVTSIECKKQKSVYAKYKDQWYLVEETTKMSPRTMCLFDAVIFVNTKGEYEVAKDRGFSVTTNTIPEVQFELFMEGKTLDEIPRFRFDENRFPNGPLNLYREENGDLVAMSAISDYDQTN